MNEIDLELGNCRFQILVRDTKFLGLGHISICGRKVRSGRLPLTVWTQSFGGAELVSLAYLGTHRAGSEIRIQTRATFTAMGTRPLRDHSFDPIHSTADWDAPTSAGSGQVDLVLRPAHDEINGISFEGFSYHYEYRSSEVPLYWLMDKASWELDGDITQATVINQSACSDPVITFGRETAWSTEGYMHWEDSTACANKHMTHNLPRWASHQAFDYQYRDGAALAGIYERVDLIRSLLQRDPEKPELKHFDKHIFDETLQHATPPKKIMLNLGPRSEIGHRNLWTWMLQEVHDRARAEFGLKEEPTLPHLGIAYWDGWNFETWDRDLLPAATAIGVPHVWTENCKKSAYSEDAPLKGVWHWNKCAPHEFEISKSLGGADKLRDFIRRAKELGITVNNWTNNAQALSSPLNRSERNNGNGWYVMLEDTRQKYGGAYAGCTSILNFKSPEVRKYFVDSHKAIQRETGLNGYLFDSFYNFGFMPVSFDQGRPTTMWKECLQTMKECQDAGIHWRIESFGPWGQPQHGCPRSYSLERCWASYKIYLGNDYSTVPTLREVYRDPNAEAAAGLFYALAHKAMPHLQLFNPNTKERIDKTWTPAHAQAMQDYRACHEQMQCRYLQEDGQSVIWKNCNGEMMVWNFTERTAALPGNVRELNSNRTLPKSSSYPLKRNHVYYLTAVSQHDHQRSLALR